VPQKCWIIAQISLPQAARILHEPMQPLHSNRLDPLRRILDAAGVEVVGGTNAEHERGVEPVQVAMHETLLFGRADAHPDDVGFELTHTRDKRLLFFCIEIAKRRCVGANDSCPWIKAGESLAQLIRDVLLPSVKEMRAAGEFSPAEYLTHKVGTGDALHLFVALPAANPDGRCAIGHSDEGRGIDGG